MLYDPKWNKPSVAGFKAWLERQNPDETFDYVNCNRCAVGQYLVSIGMHWRNADGNMVDQLNWFACKATGIGTELHRTQRPTFGAVLRAMDGA